MALGMTALLRNARLDAITTKIDAGAGAGTLKIYTGTRPATGAAITTEVLLATLTFSDPSAPAAAAGVLTFNAISQDSAADATGTASWGRIADSAGLFVCDCSVAVSGADININTVSIVLNAAVSVTAGTLTCGNP